MSVFRKLCMAIKAGAQPVDGSAGVFLKSGNVVLSKAWTMLGAQVSSAQTQYVYSRGTALSCVISSGGAQIVSGGGIASDCDYYGTFYISTGGLLSGGTAIHNNVTLGEVKGGTATDLLIGGISAWAYLYVTSTAALGAGVVSNLTMLTAAAFVVQPGAKAYNVLVGSSGGAYSWTYGGIVQAYDSSYVSGITFSGGYMSAVGSHTLVEDLKVVYHKTAPGFYSSAVLRGATLYPTNARVILYTGASAYNVTVSGGSLTLTHSNTYASNVQLVGSGARIDGSGTVENLYMSNAMNSGVCYAYLQPLAHANSITMIGSAICSVYSGASATNIYLSGGPVFPNSRAQFFVLAGGYASNISAAANTLMHIRGNADDIHIESNNSTYVSSGASVHSVCLSGGSIIAYNASLISGASVCSGAAVSGLLSISSGSCNDVHVYNRGLLQLRLSAQATNIRLGAYCYVSSGAHMTAVTIESAGQCYVFPSGLLESFSVSSGGRANISSGGSALSGVCLSGGSIMTISHGYLQTVTILSGGRVDVQATAAVASPTVSGGLLYMYTGGSVLSGSVFAVGTIRGGGSVTETTVHSDGLLELLANGYGSALTISSAGRLRVSSGASALAVVSNPGAIVSVYAGGYIEYA